MLRQKNILLGVCGSIAAYKAALLVRLLVKEGANVRVIMTDAATEFITPLTLGTLSGQPVLTTFSDPVSGQWHNHVALGAWADLFLVAPASAGSIAKFAGGLCDNLLCAIYLSAKCPVYIAPAMDLDMWKHPSTQHNIQRLDTFGNTIIAPAYGELASGLTGEGRLAEPEVLLAAVQQALSGEATTSPGKTHRHEGKHYYDKTSPHYGEAPHHSEDTGDPQQKKLNGKKVLVTAGPTYEAIDPVRFIGNHSSGKMGFALAEELAARGAQVELISGPTHLEARHQSIRRTKVTSAEEMYQACMQHFPESDIAILSAAVADYAPLNSAADKIKKEAPTLSLELRKSKDILAELGKKKKKDQLLIGFALETNNELENASDKLQQKNLDLIVLNSLRDEGAGFGTDTNKITLLQPGMTATAFPLKSKAEVARDIIERIETLL